MNKNRITLATAIFGLLSMSAIAQSLTDGISHLNNERFAKARSIFWSQTASATKAEAFYWLGNLYDKTDKADSAKMMYEKGIAANALYPNNYVGLGKLQLDQNNSLEAKTNFTKALTNSNPKEAKTDLLIAQAYVYSKPHLVDDAIKLINEKILLKDKANPEVFITLGDAYSYKANGGGDANNNYEKAQILAPTSARAFMKTGELFVQAKNYEEAMKGFEAAKKADPSFAPVYREIAELNDRVKKYQIAADNYKKYIELSEPREESSSRYAFALFHNKNYDEAVTVLNELKAAGSKNPVIDRVMGYSNYEQGKYPEALEAMKSFFAQMPEEKLLVSDYEYLGRAYMKNKQDSMAIFYLTKTVEMDSTSQELWGDIATMYYAQKKYLEAANAYEMKAKSIKPASQDFFLRGRAYYFGKNLPMADSSFKEVIALKPELYLGFFWRGRTLSAMDKENDPKTLLTDQAKEMYEKAVPLAELDKEKYKKDLIECYRFLGYYAIQKDDNASAKSWYEKILAVDPENADAKDVLSKLK